MTKVMFYNRNLPAGITANFALDIPAPWGAHTIRGSIIISAKTQEPMVIWPKDKYETYFAHSPASKEQIAEADNFILAEWWDWEHRGQNNQVSVAR